LFRLIWEICPFLFNDAKVIFFGICFAEKMKKFSTEFSTIFSEKRFENSFGSFPGCFLGYPGYHSRRSAVLPSIRSDLRSPIFFTKTKKDGLKKTRLFKKQSFYLPL